MHMKSLLPQTFLMQWLCESLHPKRWGKRCTSDALRKIIQPEFFFFCLCKPTWNNDDKYLPENKSMNCNPRVPNGIQDKHGPVGSTYHEASPVQQAERTSMKVPPLQLKPAHLHYFPSGLQLLCHWQRDHFQIDKSWRGAQFCTVTAQTKSPPKIQKYKKSTGGNCPEKLVLVIFSWVEFLGGVSSSEAFGQRQREGNVSCDFLSNGKRGGKTYHTIFGRKGSTEEFGVRPPKFNGLPPAAANR